MVKRQQSSEFIKNHPTGSTIGDWLIIDIPRFVQSGKHQKSKILCKCKCGKEKDVWVSDLKNNKSIKCKSCAKKGPNKELPDFILHKDYCLIPLQGKHKDKYIILDIIDIDRAKKHLWYGHTSSKGTSIYARTNINDEKWNITQFIFDDKINIYDHKDSNPLNNRRSNLRLCTQVENGRNKSKSLKREFSSKYLGVCKDKSKNKWIAYIWKDNKCFWSKRFDCEIKAAQSRDIKAKEIYGEFTKLNFPENNKESTK